MKRFLNSIVAAICSIVMSIVSPIKAAVNKVAAFFATVYAVTKSDIFKARVYPMVKFFFTLCSGIAFVVVLDAIAYVLLSVGCLPYDVAVVITNMISGTGGATFVTLMGLLSGFIAVSIFCRDEKYKHYHNLINPLYTALWFFGSAYITVGCFAGVSALNIGLVSAQLTAFSSFSKIPSSINDCKKFFEEDEKICGNAT